MADHVLEDEGGAVGVGGLADIGRDPNSGLTGLSTRTSWPARASASRYVRKSDMVLP
jgi:hypothetical protein